MGNKRRKEKKRHSRFNIAGGMHSFQKKQKITCRRDKLKLKSTSKAGKNAGSFSLKKKHGLRFTFTKHCLSKAQKYMCLKHPQGLGVTIKKKEQQLLGNRIVNLQKLQQYIGEISIHSALCDSARELALRGKDAVKLIAEDRHGLFLILKSECLGCHTTFELANGSDLETAKFKVKDINVRGVWGSMVSGGGYSSLTEQLGTLGVPSVNEHDYSKIEEQIGEWWKAALSEELKIAGEEEKQFAIESDSYFQGVPAVTVVCDGGWSKRSHKHTYNAMGGVGVIFGLHTRKLLHIGIRNRLCYICSRAENANATPKPHECYKNWTESSQSMEANIILEGFLECEKVHGVRYMKLIADGDSSVYASIVQNVPVWGSHVQKLECANHSCKCLRVNLERLADEKPQYKGAKKLSKTNIQRIVIGVRCAIRMRSQETNVSKATKQLKQDIRNAGKHVLGLHDSCSTDFCKNKEQTKASAEVDEEAQQVESDCIQDQCDFWTGAVKDLDETEIERVRKGGKSDNSQCNESMLKDIYHVLNRMAEKADRLIGNFTSNLAESWMHIRCKFDGGKMSNRCFRGSFYARCYGGSLRAMQGPAWSPVTYSQVTSQRPDDIFLQTYRRRAVRYVCTKRQQSTLRFKKYRSKRKLTTNKVSTSKKAKQDYGPGVLIDTKDIGTEQMKTEMDKFYEDEVKKSEPEIAEIELVTRGQSCNEKWKDERKKRLTSSIFGEVMSRSVNNNTPGLTRRLLYSNFGGNKYTRKGLMEEENTRKEYTNLNNKEKPTVESITVPGLIIDIANPHLASSSDGIVKLTDGSSGLIEIKNLLQNSDHTIKEAASKQKSFCMCVKNNNVELKTRHKYFYQIQGQLNILDKEWCDLVIRRTNPYDIFIQRIFKDARLWKEDMLPKLTSFYFTHLLPELAAPRHNTTTGIRKPTVLPWFEPSSRPASSVRKPTSLPRPCSSRTSPSLQQLDNVAKPSTSQPSCKRRQVKTKFVGRRIQHKWEEEDGKENWYCGTVTGVKNGQDGQIDAIYEVFYDEDAATYEVEGLPKDYMDGSLRFCDI